MKYINLVFLLIPIILFCFVVIWEFVIEDVFEESSGIEEDYEDTGLGLAISKTIVDHHGGDISISSNQERAVNLSSPSLSPVNQKRAKHDR